jgi:large subunit ribosomal protein L30
MTNTIKVKLVKGLIGTRQDHRATVRLGLRRVNSVSELQDTRRCAA